MSLRLPNEIAIQQEYPRIYEALRDITDAINQGHQVAGVNPVGIVGAPKNPGSIAVVQASGTYDAVITDPSPDRTSEYFIEYDTSANFTNPRLVQHSVSRYYRATLNIAVNTFWRFYKQARGSNPSPYVNFGGATPTAVAGAGAGPSPGTPVGSGSSKNGGQGFGPIGQIKPPPK